MVHGAAPASLRLEDRGRMTCPSSTQLPESDEMAFRSALLSRGISSPDIEQALKPLSRGGRRESGPTVVRLAQASMSTGIDDRNEYEIGVFRECLQRWGVRPGDIEVAVAIVEDLLALHLPAELYKGHFFPLFNKGKGGEANVQDLNWLYHLARIVISADVDADVLVATMHVGPMRREWFNKNNIPLNEDEKDYTYNFWNHPVIVAMVFVKCARRCAVRLVYNHIVMESFDSHSSWTYNALTKILNDAGIPWVKIGSTFSGRIAGETHCKFILVSKTRNPPLAYPPTFEYVIGQASGNMYHDDVYTRNDVLISHSSFGLFRAYLQAFYALFWNLPEFPQPHAAHELGFADAFFVPSPRGGLNLSPSHACTPQVSMVCKSTPCPLDINEFGESPFSWHLSRLRGPGVVQMAVGHAKACHELTREVLYHLFRLRSEGASVRVVVGPDDKAMKFIEDAGAIAAELGVPKLEIRSRYMHNKYMITYADTVVGFDAGDPHNADKWEFSKDIFVQTGSLNINQYTQADSAMRVNISWAPTSDTFGLYINDFAEVWGESDP